MFELDIFGNPQPLNIYLCRVDGSVLGSINEIIEESTATLSVGVNRQYQLSFDIMEQYYDTWFEQIMEGMYLFVEKIGLFKINNPSIELDGLRDRRSISALSVDSELDDKNCHYLINTGLNTAEGSSLEFNVIYEDGETEQLVNEYTGIPYDWIVLYNTFPQQLTNLKNQVESGYYGDPDSSGEIVVTDTDKISELKTIFTTIPRLLNKIVKTENPDDGSYDATLVEYVIVEKDENNQEIITSYTLTDEFIDRIDYLIEFYTKYGKQLSLLDIICEETANSWSVGDIPGLADGDYSFANKKYQFEINETAYAFLTQSLAQALECVISFDNTARKINIIRVQDLGEDTGIIIGFDTLVNTLNISADEDRLTTRIDVSGGENLNINTINFGTSIVDDLSYKINARDSHGKRIYVSDELAEKYIDYVDQREIMRERFKQLSVEFEEINDELYELKNRVPLDDLKTDWGTFSMEELEASLTTYKNLLATLSSLYKDEFGTAGLNPDGSIKESFIRNTAYWWDYKAYLSIIEEIKLAIEKFPDYKDHTSWQPGDVQRYEQIIQAWETEWSLYGTIELQAKIDRYKNELDSLAEAAVVRKAANTYEIKMWIDELSTNGLTEEERAQYGGIQNNYHYDEYMQIYNLMLSAQAYLDTLTPQVTALEEALKANVEERTQITEDVKLKNNFTNRECVIINRLFRDSTYQNENILSTKIDSPAEKMEHIQELLDDARDQISIVSRPQLNFSIAAENVLGVSAFNPLWEKFIPGNYIYVQYKDDTYVKLRLIGYSFNPVLPSSNNLSIEFSNFVRSRSYYRDWASLWGSGSSSGSGGYSSGGGGGSAGNYGEHDDIDITISNTMLAKLLNSETFGTRVTDVILDTIDANKITARSATFGGLADGTTHIDGDCITTGVIKSRNYDGEIITVSVDDETMRIGTLDNTEGSVLNIADGTFSFAGGRMKFERAIPEDILSIRGTIIANSGQIGGWDIKDNSISKLVNAPNQDDNNNLYDFVPQLNTPVSTLTNAVNPKTTAAFTVGVRKNDNVNTPGSWSYPFAIYYDGSIKATKGTLGGWTLTSTHLYASGTVNVDDTPTTVYTGLQIPSSGYRAFAIGATNFNDWTTAPFYVNHDGSMVAKRGTIGGWTIKQKALENVSPSVDGMYYYRTQLRTYDYNNNHIAFAIQSATTENMGTNLQDKIIAYYNGKFVANNAVITGEIYATSGSFSGSVYATEGTLGGWTLTSTHLYASGNNPSTGNVTRYTGLQIPSQGANALAIGATNFNDWTTAPFYVTHKGEMHSILGTIGGWTIDTNRLHTTNPQGNYVSIGNGTNNNQDVFVVRTGTEGSYVYPFYVRATGLMHASNIEATGGTIGGWTIDSHALYSGTKNTGTAAGDITFSNVDFQRTIQGSSKGELRLAIGSNFAVNKNGFVYANSGTLGGWTLDNRRLYASGNNSNTGGVERFTGLQIPSQGANALAIGATDFNNWTTAPFYVTHKGDMHAKSGTIGGWSIGSSSLSNQVTNGTLTATSRLTRDQLNIEVLSGNPKISVGVIGADGGRFCFLEPTGVSGYSGVSAEGWLQHLELDNVIQQYVVHSDFIHTFKDLNGLTRRVAIGTSRTDGERVSAFLMGSSTSYSGKYRLRCTGQTGGSGSAFSTFNVVDNISDVRLKKNIKDTKILSAMSIINSIKVRSFDWKDTNYHQDIGFIADELEKIDPHLAIGGGYDENGAMDIKSVDGFYLQAYEVKAIQELSSEIAELKDEIRALKARLNIND